jgi:CDP-diacylglycerol--glycerol-3-phosphate 3-phosphatidyltransferase
MLQAAAVNVYVLWLVRSGLGKNHSAQNTILRPELGYANWLTIGRGILIGALGGFLFQTPPFSETGYGWLVWLPGAMYLCAALMDYVDGYLARVTRTETKLGEWLDTKLDALGLLVAPLLAIGYDRLPVYYIGVSLAYYLFQFSLWHKKRNNRPIIAIKPHPAKRMIAGFQMALVAVALLPVFPRPVMTVAATIFMIPLLAGFVRDAGVAGGYFMVDALQQTRFDYPVGYFATRQLPVFLRLMIGATIILLIYDAGVAFLAGKSSETIVLLEAPMPFELPALLIFAAAGLMVAIGFMARSVALLIAVIVAGSLTTWNDPFSLFFLLSCALMLTLTGSGSRSLWQPEDRLILERQG